MRTVLIFIAALASLAGAIWLRMAKGYPLREHITKVLGYEVRALVEHLLAAISIPVLACLVLFLGWWVAEKALAMLRIELHGIRLVRRITPVPHFDKFADPGVVFFATTFFAFLYCAAEFWFEWQQATVGVYGGPPRGYFQSSQFAVDCLGAVLGSTTTWLVAKKLGVGA